MRGIGASCYVNKVTFGKCLRMELVVRRTNHVLRGLYLSVPTYPHLLGRREELKVESTAYGQLMAKDLTSHA